jgi:hypothetical protein
MLLLAVSPRSAKRGSSIITAASNEPPSHSIHSRDQTRRVHSRGAVQSNMALFYSISTKAAPICTTHTAIVSRICIVSVRRAAWTTRPHIQAVCLVTLMPLMLPLLLPQPLLSLLLFLQSAVCCCCCRLLSSCRCCSATAEPLCCVLQQGHTRVQCARRASSSAAHVRIDWEVLLPDMSVIVPEQDDSVNCGMYVIMYVEALISGHAGKSWGAVTGDFLAAGGVPTFEPNFSPADVDAAHDAL